MSAESQLFWPLAKTNLGSNINNINNISSAAAVHAEALGPASEELWPEQS